MSRGQGNELLNCLEAAGLIGILSQKVINSRGNYLALKVVELIQNSGLQQSRSQEQACAIMGKNFFGVLEAIKHFGVTPSEQQLTDLSVVPFDTEVLKSCKDTHVLVALFPLSILDIRDRVERKLFSRHQNAWFLYEQESFAKEKGTVSWQLVRKTEVDDSTKMQWTEQQALHSLDEETPTALVLVYTIIGHFLQTGERLFKNVSVRTSSLDVCKGHVRVGSFTDDLSIEDGHDSARYNILGVSSKKSKP